MSFKRLSAFALTAVFSLGTLVAAETKSTKTEADAKAPRLTLIEPLKDFGTVPKGDKIEHTFLVKNTGTNDLEILSASPTCGCTVAEFDKLIKPGQTGKVRAVIDTAQFAGPISKSVTLQTNDPATPSSQLTIHAIIKPYVDAFPAGFVRFQMLQGDAQTQTVTLYSEEDEPFVITKVETPGDYVKVNYSKIEKEADRAMAGKTGQTQYRVDITVGGADAKVGPLSDKVQIHTNSKRTPVYPISVSGLIRPTYTVAPQILNFGEVAPGEPAAERTITFTSNAKDSSAFKITKVESSVPGVKADMKQVMMEQKAEDGTVSKMAAPGKYEVTVWLTKEAKQGMLDGNVKVYTTDAIKPVYELAVKGKVKPTQTSSN